MNAEVVLVTNSDLFKKAMADLSTAEVLAVDTETTGLDRFAEVVGISFAADINKAYYIPIKIWTNGSLVHPWSPHILPKILSGIKELLTKSKRLVAHNAVYDAKVIENTFSVNIINNILGDTQLLHHTAIDENPPHGLKDLATQFITATANSPQDDLKDSVIKNGGVWKASDKEMYKGDFEKLGHYCGMDSIYCLALYNKWMPIIESDTKLLKLWNEEVLPLMKVSYDLNTNGFRIDVNYFVELKKQIEDNVNNIEQRIFSAIGPQLDEYEFKSVITKTKITPRSALGRELISLGWDGQTEDFTPYKEFVVKWAANKQGKSRLFNLDSNDDKAFLLYDVLGFEVTKTTASGKRSVTRADFDRIIEETEGNEVVELLARRAKEIKILSTYVEGLLQRTIDGHIYPDFKQTGTVSGRYSSNNPNFQNIPRDDLRIKSGIKPKEGYVFVAADFSALEPRAFAFMSNCPAIKQVYWNDLDLYSKVAIDVLGLTGVSPDPKDPMYLGSVDKPSRQFAKVITLAIPYGVGPYRLAELMKTSPEEAESTVSSYLEAYPELADYMRKSEFMAMKYGYVENIVGRRKRFKIVPVLYSKFKLQDISFGSLSRIWPYLAKAFPEYNTVKELYRAAKTELNLAKNFRIQSLAASITNASMIKLREDLLALNLDAKVCSQIHDEIVVMAHESCKDQVAELLQNAMENNWVAKLLDVPMLAEPVIANSLAEAK
jgi:DNA polymerase I-like protein with 3'-5' exonuclease and polymerase domains